MQSVQFSCSVVSDSVTPWTAAGLASLSIANSQSLLKLMSIKSVTPASHLILYGPLLLLSSIFASVKVFPMSQFWKSKSDLNVQPAEERYFPLANHQILFGTYGVSCPRDMFTNKTEVIPVPLKLRFLLGKINSKQGK